MQKFIWNESFSVGNAELDAQHIVVVDMINALIDAHEEGATQEQVGEMLGKLTAYACSHLTFEEERLIKAGYPDLAAHQAEHDKFRQMNGSLHVKALSGGPEVLVEILSYLRDWWSDHILVTDMGYKGRIGA